MDGFPVCDRDAELPVGRRRPGAVVADVAGGEADEAVAARRQVGGDEVEGGEAFAVGMQRATAAVGAEGVDGRVAAEQARAPADVGEDEPLVQGAGGCAGPALADPELARMTWRRRGRIRD